MKRFELSIILLLIISVMSSSLCVTIFAENYANGWDGSINKSQILDDVDIFSDKQEQELNEKIRETAKELEMNIYILAAGPDFALSDRDTETLSEQYYDKTFGEDTDGVFFFMDLTGKIPAYDYIATSGKAVLKYQDHIYSMLDEIADGLPSSGSDYSLYADNFYDAVVCFLDQLSKYNDQKSYYYDENSGKYFYFKSDDLIISKSPPLWKRLEVLRYALPIGAITAVICYFAVKSRYKFKKTLNPNAYVSTENTHFVCCEDRLINTHTTRQKIESSSGHSGGGHSSHSSGGGHGGGGRHR